MTVLFDRIEALVVAVQAAIADGTDPMPGRVGVYNGGDIAADACCEGQLYGRWLRSFPMGEFPAAAQGLEGCATEYVAEIAVGILRCAPVPQGNALAPTMAKIGASAQLLHRDADAVLTAVAAWGSDVVEADGDSWVVNDSTPLGPEGDCLGVEVSISMSYDPRCCT